MRPATRKFRRSCPEGTDCAHEFVVPSNADTWLGGLDMLYMMFSIQAVARNGVMPSVRGSLPQNGQCRSLLSQTTSSARLSVSSSARRQFGTKPSDSWLADKRRKRGALRVRKGGYRGDSHKEEQLEAAFTRKGAQPSSESAEQAAPLARSNSKRFWWVQNVDPRWLVRDVVLANMAIPGFTFLAYAQDVCV